MMEMLRQSVGGWVAKIFIGLLVLSFAVWGVSDAFLGGQQQTVVQVGDTKIDTLEYRLAYDSQVNMLSQQLRQPITRDQARAFGIEDNILRQMINAAILDENASNMGLGLSDDRLATQIGNDPAFRDASGRFSRQQLAFTLRNIGMSEAEYVRSREAVAVRNHIVEGISANTELPDAFFNAMNEYQNQKRKFDYVLVGRDRVTETPEPTESDIAAFYDLNKNDYRAPEYRKIQIVKLEPEDILDEDSISEDDLKADYEARKASFTEPEQRRIRQLVVGDKEKAQSLVDRLNGGETFEAIVTAEGKTLADTELGMFKKSDVPDQAIAEAAFQLELNNTSEVIEGLFGAVILQVTEILPERVSDFETIKDQLRNELAMAQATRELADVHDRLEDERGAGATLAEAAEKSGLKPRMIEAVDRAGRDTSNQPIADLPNTDQLLNAVFSTDEGIETDPLTLGTDGFLWYEVQEIIDERQKPLDEVREEVKSAWVEAEITKRVSELATQIKDAVAVNGDLEKAARETLKLDAETESPVKESASLLRTDTSDDFQPETVQAGFSAKEGEIVIAPATNGNYAVLLVKEVETPENTVAVNVREQMNEQTANDLLVQMISNLEANSDVFVNRAAIDAALSYGQ